MTLDLTAFDAMIKDHYAPGEVENLGYELAPAFALIKKRRGKLVGGRKWVQPIGTRLVNGGSSNFTVANSKTANESKHDAFEVTRAKHYRIAKIDNEAIEATSTGDQDAFEEAMDEIDKCIAAEGNWANFRLYRGRGGALFRMNNAGVGVAIITADDAAGVWGVSQGDVLQLSDTDGTSGAVRAGTLTVASVQHALAPGAVGTVTCTGNISAGVGAALVNDYVFLEGDHGTSYSLSPAGFADYVPDSAVTAATTLFSLDRSVSNLLGGVRIDGTTQTLSDTITEMVAAHCVAAGKMASGTKVLFANPLTVATLSKQLDGKWVIMQNASFTGGKSASIGTDAFQIDFMGVKVNVVQDRHCPVKRLYLIDIEKWVMFHAGMFPNFLTKRSNILKPAESSDAWECRTGGYLNNCTKSPQSNVVALL